MSARGFKSEVMLGLLKASFSVLLLLQLLSVLSYAESVSSLIKLEGLSFSCADCGKVGEGSCQILDDYSKESVTAAKKGFEPMRLIPCGSFLDALLQRSLAHSSQAGASRREGLPPLVELSAYLLRHRLECSATDLENALWEAEVPCGADYVISRERAKVVLLLMLRRQGGVAKFLQNDTVLLKSYGAVLGELVEEGLLQDEAVRQAVLIGLTGAKAVSPPAEVGLDKTGEGEVGDLQDLAAADGIGLLGKLFIVVCVALIAGSCYFFFERRRRARAAAAVEESFSNEGEAISQAQLAEIIELQRYFGFKKRPNSLELRKRFRAKARKIHPDMPGGSTEDFAQLSVNYQRYRELLAMFG